MLTLVATAVSAVYVTSHLKNPHAPLQPVVLNSSNIAPSTVQPVTSTYAS